MTNIPYVLPKVRHGLRMGHDKCLDAMLSDGLWDPFNDVHMGSLADMCAQKHEITREQAVSVTGTDPSTEPRVLICCTGQCTGALLWSTYLFNNATLHCDTTHHYSRVCH